METTAPMELTDTPKTVANLLASARSVRVSALWTAAGVYGTPTMLTARVISKIIQQNECSPVMVTVPAVNAIWSSVTIIP